MAGRAELTYASLMFFDPKVSLRTQLSKNVIFPEGWMLMGCITFSVNHIHLSAPELLLFSKFLLKRTNCFLAA